MRTFEYPYMLYNEVIFALEEEWERPLTNHEKHVLIKGYQYGRMVEAENEIRILEVAK